MEKIDITKKVIEILSDSSNIDKEEILKTENLLADEIIDSVGMIELISCLEKVYSITFSEDDLTIANFEEIEKIVNLIQKKTK